MKLLILILSFIFAILTFVSTKIVNHRLDPILLQAVQDEDIEGIRELFSSSIIPDIEAKDNNGWTALMHAVWSRRTKIAKMLIANGADVNAKDNNGWTALMHAVWGRHTTIAKLLIDNGADINIKNDKSKTALMHASVDGNTDMAKLLIDAGANVDVRDNTDWTARDCYRNKDEFDNIVAEYIAKIRSIIQEQDQLIPDLGNIITDYI
jgi:ankyrin repeat protein